MITTLVFETHAITEDNERGIATGWWPGRLSAAGRESALRLGARRREDGLAAVFASDLHRAVETAAIAFDQSPVPVLHDWRLRECDYGRLNGATRDVVHGDRGQRLDQAYPEGESWRGAVERVAGFLRELPTTRWAGARILVIGHVATHWALDHVVDGVPLEDLASGDHAWQEGWEYRLGSGG